MIRENHLGSVPFGLFRYERHDVGNLSILFDFSIIIRIMGFVKPHRPPCDFRLCRRCAVKDGCLPSRESGMEACVQLSREILSGEAIHITSTFLAVLGAIGSVCSIVSLVLYLLDKKHEKDNEKKK